ncbi:MAG: amidohydrolase/deacetylase family metallohydrolase [Candidatus Latescibacteria bacterium]|jgi:dihydroorotase|nr:amidohydrolase/deacetylase family metallohydrolase [Candidatus Latescibacterota bacterium]
MKRRNFFKRTMAGSALLSGAAGMTASSPALAQGQRKDVLIRESGKYDILLKGGHVIDPANNINSKNMDVAVSDGKISAVGRNIPSKDAKKAIDVSGLYVTPGFIDLHVHVMFNLKGFVGRSIIADDHSFTGGCTTMVDAGTAGALSFEQFKKNEIDNSRVRILAFVNIAAPGMTEAEQDPRTYDIQKAVATAQSYPDIIVGFKVAHYWTTKPYDSLHTPWANVDAVEEAGRKAGLPVMFDWFPRPASEGYPMRSYRELILEKSRPGDIYTHHYARHIPVIGEDGKVNPDVFKAQKRGFIFDTGHGAGSFVWRNVIPAIEQGFISDTISTDLHGKNTNGPVINMIHVMSKYVASGVPLERVIEMSTIKPARVINHPELGNLSAGASADIAVFDQLKGDFEYTDTSGAKERGNKKLMNMMTLSGGKVEFDPYGLSVPYWKDIPKGEDYWVNQSGQFF